MASVTAEPADRTPAATGNVVEVLEADGRFTILLQLIGDPGPMTDPSFDNTLFAPTDEAFEMLPDETMLKLEEDPQFARDLVRRHITGGRQRPEDMGEWLRSGVARTAAGGSVEFTVKRSGYGYEVLWGGAPVIEPNLVASNGLIHVLGGVVLPPADAHSD